MKIAKENPCGHPAAEAVRCDRGKPKPVCTSSNVEIGSKSIEDDFFFASPTGIIPVAANPLWTDFPFQESHRSHSQ